MVTSIGGSLFCREQITMYRTQATRGEIVDIVFHKNRPVDLFVEHNGKRMQVEPYFVPKELKQGPFDTTLLKAAYFSVSHFKEGGCRVDFNLRLRGGMLALEGVETSLAERDGYGELVAAIDRNLKSVPIQFLSDLQCVAVLGGGTVLSAMAGGAAGGMVTGGPGGALLGAGLAGMFYYLSAASYVGEQEEKAAKVRADVDQIYEYFVRASELLERGEKTAAFEQTEQLKQFLQDKRYMLETTHYGLRMNDSKFEEISYYFDKEYKKTAMFCLKFIIFSTLTICPRGECPLDALIDNLCSLIIRDERDRSINPAVENRSRAVIGRLFVEKGGIENAIEWFESIPSNSDVFAPAQRIISSLRQRIQRGLT